MSRPSVVEQKYDPRRNGVIDFVNTPLPPQAMYPSPISCGYDDPYAPGPPTPAYVVHAPGHVPMGAVGAPYPHQQFVSAPVPQLHAVEHPVTVSAPATATRINEEDLDQKINSQINSIMAAHKAEMLCSKVDSLTHKIQKMSHSMDMAKMANSSSNSYDDAPHSSGRVSSDYESAIGNSLRRLAEESNTSNRRRSVSQARKPRF